MSKIRYDKLLIFGLALLVPLGMSVFDFFELLELSAFNVRFQLITNIKNDSRLLHLDVDDESINLVGRWPWPREKIAQAIEVLEEFKPRQIIFDIEFTESSATSVNKNKLQDSLTNLLNANLEYLTNNVSKKAFVRKDRFIQKFLEFQQMELMKSVEESFEDPDAYFAWVVEKLKNVYLTVRGDVATKSLEHESLNVHQAQFFEIAEKDPYIFKRETPIRFLEFNFAYTTVNPLYKHARGFGFTNAYFDIDHLVRRVPLFLKINGFLVPDLAFRPVLEYLQIKPENIILDTPGTITLKNAIFEDGSTEDIKIPVTKKGELIVYWVNQSWPGMFRHYNLGRLLQYRRVKAELAQTNTHIQVLTQTPKSSEAKGLIDAVMEVSEMAEGGNPKDHALKYFQDAQQVWQEQYDFLSKEIQEKLHNAICFVGLTATGTSDIGSVPVDLASPLVAVRSNFYNTILQQRFLWYAPWYIGVLCMLVFNVSFMFVSTFIKKTLLIPFVGIALVAVYLGLNVLFFAQGVIIGVALTTFSLLINVFSDAIHRFMAENKNKEFIKGAFGQYLSPKIIERLIDDPSKVQLGGERVEITAFFSDLAKFSTISENLTPEELVQLLNHYLTEMSGIILKYDGLIDKYEGDAIIACWGAPVAQSDHALRACQCALEMQERLKVLAVEYTKKINREFKMRIGLNSGPAVVGNMGSMQRMDYTMMGDTVNLASRLEGGNKFYKTYTMISEYTYAQVSEHIEARKLDIIRVVGKDTPIIVYEPLAKKGEMSTTTADLIEVYLKGYALYQQKDFSQAAKTFSQALQIVPTDGPSQVMLERCELYIHSVPDKDWDGVFNFSSK